MLQEPVLGQRLKKIVEYNKLKASCKNGNNRYHDWWGGVECGDFHRGYLARALGGSDDAALDEKKRHDKALEAYQAAYTKYNRERTQLLDWVQTNAQIKSQAKQNFTNTDYAFKLYNQVNPDKRLAPLKEPKFSDFYQPSAQQKNGELSFLGAGTLALG